MKPPLDRVQTQIFKTIQNERLRNEWDQLVLQMEVPQVFFTAEWALAVERAFHSSLEPWIFVFRRDDVLIGVAALASKPTDRKKLFFLAASTGDYCDIVSAPNDRTVAVAALLNALHQQGIRKITLTNIPEESATISALSESRGLRYWCSRRPAYECSRIVLQDKRAGTDSGNAPNHLPSPLLKDEKLRRLARLGPIKLQHLRIKEDVCKALDSVMKAQITRFLATSRLSPLLTPERRCFLLELNDLLSRKGWLNVSVLKVADRDVAWNFGFRFQGVVFWYLPTFDMSLEALSPGAGLLRMMMDEFVTDPAIKEIDLGLGDEGYKARVANDSRKTLTFTLSSSLVAHTRPALARILARIVKAWAPFEHSARFVLQRGMQVKGVLLRKRALDGFKTLFRKTSAKVFSSEEISFFEWPDDSNVRLPSQPPAFKLSPITWDVLAETALQHCDDPDTLEYLKRSARRLRNAKGKCPRGYILISEAGEALHYCWTADFGGFQLAEIHHRLEPSADAMMIFDCWTPKAQRNRHSYRIAVECLARELRQQGKSAWIFSAAKNLPSLHALQNSCFEYRYSLLRRKFIYRMPVEKLRAIDNRTA